MVACENRQTGGLFQEEVPTHLFFLKDNQLLHAISKVRISIVPRQRSHHASSDRLKEAKNNGKYIRQDENWSRLFIRGGRDYRDLTAKSFLFWIDGR